MIISIKNRAGSSRADLLPSLIKYLSQLISLQLAWLGRSHQKYAGSIATKPVQVQSACQVKVHKYCKITKTEHLKTIQVVKKAHGCAPEFSLPLSNYY